MIEKPAWFSILMVFIIGLFGCQPQTSSIYLIPEGFTGRITIYYGHPNGQPAEMEGDYRLIRLPNQPCTTSAFEAIYGTFKHQYYVVDASGNRKRIPIAVELDNDEGLGIFHLVTGNTQEAPVYHFESFFVGSRSAYAHNKSVELNRDCLD